MIDQNAFKNYVRFLVAVTFVAGLTVGAIGTLIAWLILAP